MKKDLRCSQCKSSQVYFRVKTNDYHCVKCGFDFNLKEEKND